MFEEKQDAIPKLLTLSELSDRSRLSVATIHRLKSQGKIPYYQPAGKGGRLLFPADAIQQAASEAAGQFSSSADDRSHLSGRLPAWMNANPN